MEIMEVFRGQEEIGGVLGVDLGVLLLIMSLEMSKPTQKWPSEVSSWPLIPEPQPMSRMK